MYLVSVYFDEKTDRKICGYIEKIAEKEQMLEAFAIMQSSFAPFEGKVTRIGLAVTNPHRDIRVWEIT